jgi:phosphohistidine phosphatase
LKLYIMRHGPAEDDSATGRDADRALTAKGRDRVRAVAERLVADGEVPRVILTSPLVRAAETARIVEHIVDTHLASGSASSSRSRAPLEIRDELAGNGAAKGVTLVHELVRASEDTASVLLVGHQPDLSEIVIDLTMRSVAMDKAMVVAIDAVNGTYTLRFVLDPKTLDYLRT